jgi:prepilin-type N-terminal cleavage/methylation domain-containing protein
MKTFMKNRTKQRGMTLIELMIALTVLTVGLLALMGLFSVAIASNNRNKLDTGGTFAAQAILETIAAQPAGTDVSMTDCVGNNITVKTASPAVGVSPNYTGANIMTDGTGRIDFQGQTAASVTTGYKASYVGCGPAGKQVTYDVRWNIQTISAYSRLVTVGAAQTQAVKALGTANQLKYFNPPVTLRTISATGN